MTTQDFLELAKAIYDFAPTGEIDESKHTAANRIYFDVYQYENGYVVNVSRYVAKWENGAAKMAVRGKE